MEFTKMTVYILNSEAEKFEDIYDILWTEFNEVKNYGHKNICCVEDDTIFLKLFNDYISISATKFDTKPETFSKFKKIADKYLSVTMYEDGFSVVNVVPTENNKYKEFVELFLNLMMKEHYSKEQIVENLSFLYKYRKVIYECKDVFKTI